MTEVLDKIDDNLSRIEERLLSEFLKIQQSETETGYGMVGDSLKQQVKDAIAKLRHRLDHSGSGRLELTTDYHEVLRARMFVLEKLLERKVATVCMGDLYRPARSIFTARDVSETRSGGRSKTQMTKSVSAEERESSNRSFLQFFRGHFGSQKSGAHNIRVDSAGAADKRISDSSPYAAAQQLAALASAAVTFREIADTEGEEAARAHAFQQRRGKATFDARDLSASQQVKLRDIARSPEEIRKKLEARRAAEGSGKASFTSVDLAPVSEKSDSDRDGRPTKDDPPKERAQFASRDLKTRSPNDKR